MNNFGDEYPNSGSSKLNTPVDWSVVLAALALVSLILLAVWGGFTLVLFLSRC